MQNDDTSDLLATLSDNDRKSIKNSSDAINGLLQIKTPSIIDKTAC